MAFGDVKGVLTVATTAITNPLNTSGSVAVALNDLIFVVVGETGAVTSTAVTDNLGNTYSAALTSGTLSVGIVGFYSLVTVAGTLTVNHIATTASKNDGIACAAVFTGPFAAVPLDKNPSVATGTSATVTCAASGVLTQGDELIVAYMGNGTNPQTGTTATSPNILVAGSDIITGTGNSATGIALGSQVVAITNSVTPVFTVVQARDFVGGTATFKKAAAADTLMGMICM